MGENNLQGTATTRFITLREAGESLGYKDRRPVIKWLTERGIVLIKVGKRHCVLREEFETAIMDLITSHKNNAQSEPDFEKRKYKPSGKYEKEFLSDLSKTLSKV